MLHPLLLHVQGILRSVVVLTNTAAYPVLYEWDLGVMGQPESLSGGILDVSPASGGWVSSRLLGMLSINPVAAAHASSWFCSALV
jgi:hypothetical protein